MGGSVVYWRIDNWTKARTRIEQMGGVHHRGPLQIENSQVIGQFKDPFGNLFGVIAPFDDDINDLARLDKTPHATKPGLLN